ncbi:MAG: DUF262 domain-containing HNH endonuclease family protein [Proteobacteria bacterium]|nr:DUF262 domain-containing HNH endonuclease family protein [Pseudomonadota bacterium]
MAATTFNTSNDTYRQLMASGSVYKVPRFQRDYSWKEDNWEDLWFDILELLNDEQESSHYMGYLVLQPGQNRTLDIIDGQQRLTTLTIIVLAAMRNLQKLILSDNDAESNKTRLEEIRRTYVGQLDSVSLRVSSKLTLNRNNDDYFQTYVTTLRDLPSRGFKASEHSIRKASDWFVKKLNEYFIARNIPPDNQGAEIARVIETISSGLFFTVITVDDELNAYKVFETLNARGVKLSAPDLLKNYLFSIISRDGESHEAELDDLENRWSNILDRLQSENLTTFLRTYWGAHHTFVRQAELFKVIKRSVDDRSSAYDLIIGLEDDLETYLSLSQPELSNWDQSVKEDTKLLKMFSVRQPFAVLLAAQNKIENGFPSILRAIVNISFRYNVIGGLQAAEQERVYSRVAIGISKGELLDANSVVLELRSIYPSDDVFKPAFQNKELDTTNSRNKNILKYILGKLESQMHGNGVDIQSADLTIEHILPENPDQNWPEFTDSDVINSVYRIGNMALLESKINRDVGNSAFETKVELFKNSNMSMINDIIEKYDSWDVEQINNRQISMAKAAKSIWRVQQLE